MTSQSLNRACGLDVVAVVLKHAVNKGVAPATVVDAYAQHQAKVAELIEASRIIDERIAYYAALGEDSSPNIEQWAYTDGSGDVKRLRAALANIDGAA